MKKTDGLWIVLGSIFLLVFNTIFFLTGGTEHSSSVWLSYAFIHFAYAMLLLTPIFVKKPTGALVSGLSIFSVSCWYFFVEFITGLVFILLAPADYKPAFIVQLILAAIYGILLLLNLIADEHTAQREARHFYEVKYMQRASSELSAILHETQDVKLKKKIEGVYDALRTSPAKSHPDVRLLEEELLAEVDRLRSSLEGKDEAAAEQHLSLLRQKTEERNRKLHLLN